MMRQARGILRASKEINGENKRKFFVGSAIYKGSRLLGAAENCYKSRAQFYSGTCRTTHAEHRAILRYSRVRKGALCGCRIFVVRLTKNGSFSMSRPCSTCRRLLKFVGITDVYYTDYNGNVVYENIGEEEGTEEDDDPLKRR